MKLSCSSCHQESDVAALVEVDGQFCFVCRTCGRQNNVSLFGASPPSIRTETSPSNAPAVRGDDTSAQNTEPSSFQKCPKCGFDNGLAAIACHRCGLNFAFASRTGFGASRDQLMGNPVAERLRVQWVALKDDLDDDIGHKTFIQDCATHGALEYAGSRYRELLDSFPEDERAAAYRDRVIGAALARSGRLEARTKEVMSQRLRSLLVLLFGVLVLLGFAIGYYVLTGNQTYWNNL